MVELLVVIAILAFLAVLVVPAVQGALVRSKAAKCSSNLRAISVGIHGYVGDNNGYMPVESSAGASSDSWAKLIRDYIPTSSNDIIVDRVFRCPAETNLPPAGYAKSVNHYTTSYAVAGPGTNGQISSITNGPRKSVAISSPSKTFLVVDGVNIPGSYSCYSSRTFTAVTADITKAKPSETENISFRHGEAMNVLYADGHVGTIKWADRATMTRPDWNGTNN
jgi:prepilin-type processing-associated H-X9-DG protein